MRLTKTQADCIDHRLGVDFLGDKSDDWNGVFDFSQPLGFTIAEAVESLYEILPRQIKAKRLDRSEWNAATAAVLIDCLEGSTWVACGDVEATIQRQNGAIRTLTCLAAKVEEMLEMPKGSIDLTSTF